MTASLSPKQIESICSARARVNIWEGAVSSGKTLSSVIAWLDYIATRAPDRGRLLMIGRTRDTLYRNVLQVIEELLPAGSAEFRYTKGTDTATIFGRPVDILGANDVSAESRIRGLTAAGFYVDEWTLLPGEGYWQQLLNRLRVPGSCGFVTTNPDGPGHWAREVLDQADQLGYRVWHFLLEDNPVLTDEYVEAIKRLAQLVGHLAVVVVSAHGVAVDGQDDPADIFDVLVESVDRGESGEAVVHLGLLGRLNVKTHYIRLLRQTQHQPDLAV